MMRRVLVAASALLVLLVAAALLIPALASGWVQRRAVEEARARGVDLQLGALRLTLGSVIATDVCVQFTDGVAAPDAPPLLCATRTSLSLPLLAMLGGRIEDGTVELDGLRVDMSAAQGSLDELRARFEAFGQAQRDGDPVDDAPGGPPTGAGPTRFPAVRLSDVALRLDGQGLPFSAVTVTTAEFSADEAVAVDAAFALESFAAQIPGLRLPEGMRLHGEGADVRALTWTLSAAEPWEIQLPGVGRAAWRSLTFDGQRTFAVAGLDAELAEPPARLEAERAEVELRDLTTELHDLYLARASLVRPRLSIDGAALERAWPRNDAAATGDAEAAVPEGSADAGGAADGSGDADDPWADRQWWERIPQQIVVEDGAVLVDRGNEDVEMRGVELRYALRAIGLQADVKLDAALFHADTAAGTVGVEVVWQWANEVLRFDVDAKDVALAAVAAVAPGLRSVTPVGTVSVRASLRETEEHTIERFEGSLEARDLGVRLELLQAPTPVGALTFSWEVGQADDTAAPIVFAKGDGNLNGAAFSFTPTVHGFDYHRERWGDRVDVRLSVPDQDGAALLRALPAEVLGPLARAELRGTWGFDIAFPITFGERGAGDRRRPITIGESTTYEVRDDSLELVSLPEEVDVRKLNRAFDFVFSGPGDTVRRALSAPAPRGGGDAAAVGAEGADADGAAPAAPGGAWARLNEMSYFLVAAILYNEDGSFFRNRGINWFQWRAVVAAAWRQGELGRGASTVSMQLVKNVFLSHERSVERKIRELLLTYWMTRLVPKERILEVYLNVIELGPGVNGVAEAASYYFGKGPADLTLAESVWISSIVPAPVRRGRARELGVLSDYSVRYSRDVMTGMERRGWITATELSRGLTEPIRFVTAAGIVEATWEEADATGADAGAVDAEPSDGATSGPADDALALDDLAAGEGGAPLERPATGDRLQALIATSLPLRPGPAR